MNIFILKGTVKSEHYWVYNSSIPSFVTRVFNRVSAQVTIQAAIYSSKGSCNDTALCYVPDSNGLLSEKPIIMWKNPDLKFYVTRSLTLKNIIFDGADIVPQNGSNIYAKSATFHANSISVKSRYCLDQSIGDSISLVPNPAYPESKFLRFPSRF